MPRQVKLSVCSALLATLLLLVVSSLACSALPREGTTTPPSGTPVVPPGLAGRLLYTRDGGLWTLALDTARSSQIVSAPELGQVASARWSPDGSRVAYSFAEVRDRRIPVSEIRVSTPDGSDTVTLLSSQAALAFGAPTWAPDGSHLYLTRTGMDEGQRIRRIERLDIGTGTTETVHDEVAPFDVSPDGRWLALAKAGSAGQSLALVDLRSGEQRPVVQEREFDTIAMPRFDPTSSRLLFTAAAQQAQTSAAPAPERLAAQVFGLGRAYAHGLPQDVYSAPLAGGASVRVAAISADEPAVAPSPDGGHIAIFTVDALSTMPMTGGRVTPLLSPGGIGTVDWAN